MEEEKRIFKIEVICNNTGSVLRRLFAEGVFSAEETFNKLLLLYSIRSGMNNLRMKEVTHGKA